MVWKLVSKPLRAVLGGTIFRERTVRTIFAGPCFGMRYRVFRDGLSVLYGGWEPEAQRLMIRHIFPGSVVYDVGANHGIHTLLMARLVGERGRVYAFEPVPQIFGCLEENMTLNRLINVECYRIALSDAAKSETFFRGAHHGAGHLSGTGSAEGGQIVVETDTIDAMAARPGARLPDFIKMDVEGAEGKVLAGAEHVLAEKHPVLLIDLHNPKQDLEVGSVLRKFGYVAYRTKDGSSVENPDKSWPDPHGLWGKIIALPKRAACL